ncbi:MAG TPA: hypothetical protein VEK08_19345 [Planctomycetota bacterium]|nr:hypothetical protein [Planctomycetota bacterium]
MKIGIFSNAGDRQAQRLFDALETLSSGSAQMFDLALNPEDRTALDANRLIWNGVDLAKLDAAFVRGFSYQDPILPSGGIDIDWSVWREDYIAEQMKYTYLHSLFMEMARRGVKVVNSPEQHMQGFMRPLVLEQLRRAGVSVPQSVCTNIMDVAKDFCAKNAAVVWRPVTGRASIQLFRDKQREALISLKKPPVILAELKDGPLVRGYFFENKPLLLLERYVPAAQPEETLERFFEVPCPEVREQLALAARTLNIPWVQMLFTIVDGKAWIYDVDTDPLIEGLPIDFQTKLTSLLAQKLLGRNADFEAPLSGLDEAVRQRPTMFLRRMLQILFEFEQSKYK